MSSEPADRSSRAAAELLALAEQAGRLGVVEWDVPAGTVRLSARCLELYGLDRFNFDGRYETLLACVYREDQPRAAARIEQAFADRGPLVEVDFRIVRPSDGELRWIEARRLIFYDGAGAPRRVVGVSVDVTEQKRASAQLRAFTETLEEAVRARTHELEAQHEARRKAEDLLRQSQKMEAVGQLTGGVAHDFNNLLTVIMGGLDVIGRELAKLGDIPSAARIGRARDLALQGAQRAAILTNRLLAFSRQQALDPRPLDANRLVADTAELLRRTLGEAIALETVLAGGLWLAFADQNQLETAILNLAVNARDAMPEGGKMTIETANTYLDEAYAEAVAEPLEPGQYVLIAVADTGSGMDRSALERAFEPFFTTKVAGRGTGPGPEPGLRLRAPILGPRAHLQRTRPWHDGEALPAAPSGRRRAGDGDRARGRSRPRHRPRDHPGRRGRRSAARLRRRGAGRTGLPRAARRRRPGRARHPRRRTRRSTCCSPTW